MSIIASIVARAYAAGDNTIPVTVPASDTRIKVTLTPIGNWPTGEAAQASIVWSDGFTARAWFYGNGNALLREFSAIKSAGVTSGTATVKIVQPLTCTILIESL